MLIMGRLLWRFSGFIEILRIHNLLASAVATLLGFMTVYAGSRSELSLSTSLIPISVVVLVAGGGYVINDYFDVVTDSINKPTRPIPSGRVLKDEALLLSIALMTLGIILATLIGVVSFAYALINALLLVVYSKNLKRAGLVGNLVVSTASANSILYGGLAASEYLGRFQLISYTAPPVAYAFIFTLMREIIKGVEDYVGDLKSNIKTLAVIKGVKYASNISISLMILIITSSPIPYILGLYGIMYLILTACMDVILMLSIITLIRGSNTDELIRRAALVRSYTKAAMFLGILAFLTDISLCVLTS